MADDGFTEEECSGMKPRWPTVYAVTAVNDEVEGTLTIVRKAVSRPSARE